MLSQLAFTGISWLLILPAAYYLGSLLKNFVPFEDRSLRGICYFAGGFFFLSYFVVALSYLGFLNSTAIWISLGIFFLLSLSRLKDLVAWFKGWRGLFHFLANDFTSNLLIALALLALISALLGTLTPEIGGDTLAYQIDLPKEFLRRGSIQPFLYNDNSLFPLFMNNLYLIGLATGGIFAAKLFHFATGLLMSLFLTQLIALETQKSKLAIFCGLTLFITPVVFNMISTTYIDVAVGFYIFLSLSVLIASFEKNFKAGAFLSGLFAGCAVAAKYLSLTGLLAVALTGLFCCVISKKRGLKDCLSTASLWMAGAFVACGYWLLRNWILTGNPFYPYWGHIFGVVQRPPITYFDTGMGKNVLAYFTAFANISLFPDKFGGGSTRISLLFSAFVPLAIYGAIKDRRTRPYFIFFLSFYTIWFFLVQLDRWFISALPPVLFCGALGFRLIKRSYFPKFAALSGMLILVVEVTAGVYHYRYADMLTSGQWSYSEYARRMERTVPVADWINANLPKDAVLLIEAEPRKFYIQRRIIEDKNLDWHTKYHERMKTPESMAGFLKSEGITHLLLSDSTSRPAEPNPLRSLIPAGFTELLAKIPSENIRDESFIYRVYKLKA